MQTINTIQLEQLVTSLCLTGKVEAETPVMVAGPPGCGKTETIRGAAHLAGYTVKVFHPVVSDPTDFKGFPWINKESGKASFVPFGEFGELLDATEPTLALFDDLGHAPKAVQGTLMQPFFARTLNGHKISDKVRFAAATNRRGDKAGVEGIIDPLISRCLVYELAPDLDSFLAYWVKAGHRPEVLAFLRVFPQHLYTPKKSADIENYPCYRTWEFASKILGRELPQGLELVALTGAVGQGVAGEFHAYLKLYREIPDPDEILKDPTKGKVPTKADILYALCAALAYRTTVKTFPAVAQYTERMVKEGREEMAVYLLGDALRRCPDVRNSKDCAKVLSGKLGSLLLNE